MKIIYPLYKMSVAYGDDDLTPYGTLHELKGIFETFRDAENEAKRLRLKKYELHGVFETGELPDKFIVHGYY